MWEHVCNIIIFYSDGYDTYDRDYLKGLLPNIGTIRKFYGPDWSIRLYYHIHKDSKTFQKLCNIACENPELDLCNAENNPEFGNKYSKEFVEIFTKIFY